MKSFLPLPHVPKQVVVNRVHFHSRQNATVQETTRRGPLHQKSKIHGCVQESSNAESVGQYQPRVCFETLGSKCPGRLFATLKGLRGSAVNKPWRNSFRVAASRNGMRFPRGQSATLGWN